MTGSVFLKQVKKEEIWLPIIREQKKALLFERFTNEDALQIGLRIIKLACEKYRQNVAVEVCLGGNCVFKHFMSQTTLFHEWFLRQKTNITLATGLSSMQAFLEYAYEEKHKDAFWTSYGGNYVLCGGCFPIWLKDGSRLGTITASGMAHEEDHQIVADALMAHLGISVESILEK